MTAKAIHADVLAHVEDPIVREALQDHHVRIALIEAWIREARWLNRAIAIAIIGAIVGHFATR